MCCLLVQFCIHSWEGDPLRTCAFCGVLVEQGAAQHPGCWQDKQWVRWKECGAAELLLVGTAKASSSLLSPFHASLSPWLLSSPTFWVQAPSHHPSPPAYRCISSSRWTLLCEQNSAWENSRTRSWLEQRHKQPPCVTLVSVIHQPNVTISKSVLLEKKKQSPNKEMIKKPTKQKSKAHK